MADRLLFDTNVLVDYLRGKPQADEFFASREELFLVSVISVAELFAGVRNQDEADTVDTFLRGFEVVPVTDELARSGGRLRSEHASAHGTELADAIIAATAGRQDARLVTRNEKHYPMLNDLLVPYPLS